MKTLIFAALSATFIILTISSFIPNSQNRTAFIVKVDGVKNFGLKDGILPSDLSTMTIEAQDKDISIEEFEIVLARGKRPVSYPAQTVTGNKFDLTKYSGIAKAGDRLVIVVKKVDGLDNNKLSEKESLLIIPIK